MDFKELKRKWSEFVVKMNMAGVPVPTIRDPKTGRGSVSLTLVFISFNFCIAAMVSKWSGAVGSIDSSQALNLFMICAGLYWGRKFQKDPKGQISVDTTNSVDNPDQPQ